MTSPNGRFAFGRSKSINSVLWFLMFTLFSSFAFAAKTPILIFSKTRGFREDNIVATKKILKVYWDAKSFVVDTTEDSTVFNDANLAKYKAVIFLKTSGTILSGPQKTAFEKYIRGGGGYVGIHSALDTEYGWPFYGELISGAWFKDLAPLGTIFTVRVTDTAHISTRNLPASWSRSDEVYTFKANPRGYANTKILADVDESTYSVAPAKKMGGDHPISWYRTIDLGRCWVTALGHTTASYSEPNFLEHITGGLLYATQLDAPTGILRKNKSGFFFEGYNAIESLSAKAKISGGEKPFWMISKGQGNYIANGKAF